MAESEHLQPAPRNERALPRDASVTRPLQWWESLADQRIREATAAGQFENLPGLGAPIPGIDNPHDDNWWLKRKLRDDGLSVVPPVLAARREREKTLEEIHTIASEDEVRRRLEQLNQKILEALRSPVRGPADGVLLVDIENVLQSWRDARARSARTDR